VEFQERRYFAGFEHVGQTLLVRAGESELSLWAATRHVATHPRHPLNGRYSILPEQRPQLLQKPGAKPYVKRQWLADLCPAATWYVTELRHKRSALWREDVERIFALLEEHGEERVRAALIEAAAGKLVGAEYVEAIVLGQGRAEVAS
jgi:hypothetical protein